MKALFVILSLSALLTLSGCTESYAQTTGPSEPAAAAVYKEGSGLQLSTGACELVGLKTADAAPREIVGHGRDMAVPTSALVRTVKGDFVYVANGPWFLRTPVTIGAVDREWAQVRDGLYEGDTVVIEGVRSLWLAELQAVNGGVGCADGH